MPSIVISKILDLIKSDTLIHHQSLIHQALCDDEKNYGQLFSIGLALANASRYKDVIEIFSALKNYHQNDQRVLYNLGLAHAVVGNHRKALECYEQALQIIPYDIETLINKSASLIDLSDYEEAEKILSLVVEIDPSVPQAWINQGVVLNKLKNYMGALQSYEKALERDQNLYEVWSNRALPLQKIKKFKEALDSCDRAINLKPDYAEAWYNKGVTCGELKRFEEALNYYDQAISLKPDYAEAWYNKGVVLSELGFYEDALICYVNAEAIEPDLDWLLGQLIYTKMLLCDWSGIEKNLIELRGRIEGHAKVVQPLAALALFDSPRLHQIAADIYVCSNDLSNPSLGTISRKLTGDKIRIGYFSADFQDHPVSYLTAEMFELHDKNSFEIFAFSFGDVNSGAMRQRLKKSFDSFVEVNDKSDIEIALLSRNLGIDIAVDLGGHTQHARAGIFSQRAAPVQISYAGYLGTSSAKYMDYILADKTIITTNLMPFITEKIIQLPSYQVNDRKKFLGDNRFSRADLGLPADSFVFCCFNNNYKITPETFSSWMRILKAVKGSVLFLYSDIDAVKKNLKKEASSRDVSEDRLIFGEEVSRDDYLSRYKAADLFLDTTPYNAGTTASDALWVGLPVLTLIGESFPSRMAASVLSAMGLPDLVASSQFEYESLAIELATQPEKLAAIKDRLTGNRITTPLFDTPLFTKNLEKAYQAIFERHLSGLSPEHIFL